MSYTAAQSTPAAPRQLRDAVWASPLLAPVLGQWDRIALPDVWLSGSAVAQTMWNVRYGLPPDHGIADLDLVYFDGKDIGASTESAHARRISKIFANLPARIDLKNQARVHLWYEQRYGYAIMPYRSVYHAIASFPTTASAVGVRPGADGLEICAPFGIDDLLASVVRANRAQITRAIYEAKLQRWRATWPDLSIVPWED